MIDPATITAAVATTAAGFGLFAAGGLAHIISERLEERDRAREQPAETAEVSPAAETAERDARERQPA
ncbi:Na+/glutamate symporter [Lipingzhangella halophila]|uniref:Na+/glutamate symporter n=1 Tax=Lipingzhangella halophila TaxID=1783352 RepID=A0A7W7RHB3_9ACTN|nr:hypothetical protein [Lipingzhangella halophila]MBB4931997.1 Na+/glutamate symporter [Lipingzhangella halophila]